MSYLSYAVRTSCATAWNNDQVTKKWPALILTILWSKSLQKPTLTIIRAFANAVHHIVNVLNGWFRGCRRRINAGPLLPIWDRFLGCHFFYLLAQFLRPENVTVQLLFPVQGLFRFGEIFLMFFMVATFGGADFDLLALQWKFNEIHALYRCHPKTAVFITYQWHNDGLF